MKKVKSLVVFSSLATMALAGCGVTDNGGKKVEDSKDLAKAYEKTVSSEKIDMSLTIKEDIDAADLKKAKEAYVNDYGYGEEELDPKTKTFNFRGTLDSGEGEYIEKDANGKQTMKIPFFYDFKNDVIISEKNDYLHIVLGDEYNGKYIQNKDFALNSIDKASWFPEATDYYDTYVEFGKKFFDTLSLNKDGKVDKKYVYNTYYKALEDKMDKNSEAVVNEEQNDKSEFMGGYYYKKLSDFDMTKSSVADGKLKEVEFKVNGVKTTELKSDSVNMKFNKTYDIQFNGYDNDVKQQYDKSKITVVTPK